MSAHPLTARRVASGGPVGRFLRRSLSGPALLAVAFFLLPVVATAAGTGSGGLQQANLEAFPAIDEDDLPEDYKEWLEQVDVIITKAERDVLLRCQDDSCRDRFMEKFWEVRDPTPGTPQNEYRDLHYERLEHVEFHYGRDTPRPGWMTDRGRMYLLLGEPMNVKTLPNTQLAYPIELWFYHANPRLGIPPFFYLMFFKAYGTGEYRLYSPLVDGPMKLLNPAGESQVRQVQQADAQLNAGEIPDGWASTGGFGEVSAAYDVLQQFVDAEVAQAALSLIPGDGTAAVGMPSMRSTMMIGDIENIPNRIMPTAAWAYRVLTGEVDANVRFETLPIRGVAAAFLDPSGVPFVHWAARTEGARLNLNSYEDDYYMTFEVAGALTRNSEVITGVRGPESEPRVMQASLEEADARRIRSGEFIFLDRFPAVPGEFELDLILENNVSREFGRAVFDLTIPEPRPERLGSSEPLLLWQFDQFDNWDPFTEQYGFQIGAVGMIPAIDPVYEAGGSIYLFHQVYLPATGAPDSVTAVYQLLEDGSPVVESRLQLSATDADPHGTLNAIGSLDLAEVPPGEYQVAVDIVEDDRPTVRLDVTVEEAGTQDEDDAPYVQAELRPPATDPQVGYERAIQFRRLGETDKAIQELAPVVEKAPDFEEAFDLQTELLLDANRHEEVVDLLTPRAVENPNDADLLVTLGEASAGMGRHYDAIRYYERARLLQAQEAPELVNPLAAAYFADGQVQKARELLELSLQLDPEQPEVRKLLDQIRR